MMPFNSTRRHFVGASIAALVGAAPAIGQVAGHTIRSATSVGATVKIKAPKGFKHFTFDASYTTDETKRLLKAGPIETMSSPSSSPRVGLPFWWDKTAQMLVNPYNVKYDPSITAGDYEVTATIENFRASLSELGDVWNRLSNNAQLRLAVGSTSAEDDPLKWLFLCGIDVADNMFAKNDRQLAPLTQNNTPTEQLRPAEKVIIKKGLCTLQLNISAQKKQSFWDTLLAVVKKFQNSSVFGLLPIPKIYLDTATVVTTAFDQLESQAKLLPVLTSKAYQFRIYEGAPATDLTFRPGHWVILDSAFATQHMDPNSNLQGIKLDIAGLLYQLKDTNNQPVDTTYSVANLQLNSAPTTANTTA